MNYEIIKNDASFSQLVYDTFIAVYRFVPSDVTTRRLDIRNTSVLLDLSEKRHGPSSSPISDNRTILSRAYR